MKKPTFNLLFRIGFFYRWQLILFQIFFLRGRIRAHPFCRQKDGRTIVLRSPVLRQFVRVGSPQDDQTLPKIKTHFARDRVAKYSVKESTGYLQWVQLAVQGILQSKVGEREADSVPFPASDGPLTHRVVRVVVGVPRGNDLAG